MAEVKSSSESTQRVVEQPDQKAELQKIMTEIEALQRGMAVTPTSTTPSAPSELAFVSPPLPPHGESQASPAPFSVQSIQPGQPGHQVDVEKEILKDFSGESEEPWVAETLTSLKNSKSAPFALGPTQKETVGMFGVHSSEMQGETDAKKEVIFPLPEDLIKQNLLEINLKGQVNLLLNYQNNTCCIRLDFREDAIVVRFSNGLEMKIPVLTHSD